MVHQDKYSTVRLKKTTKNELMDLDFVKKNMSFEGIIIELIKHYKKR